MLSFGFQVFLMWLEIVYLILYIVQHSLFQPILAINSYGKKIKITSFVLLSLCFAFWISGSNSLGGQPLSSAAIFESDLKPVSNHSA